jgi:hypothetical protein
MGLQIFVRIVNEIVSVKPNFLSISAKYKFGYYFSWRYKIVSNVVKIVSHIY